MEEIQKLTDSELLEEEYLTAIYSITDTSGDFKLYKYHDTLLNEIKKRELKTLPRVDDVFNVNIY